MRRICSLLSAAIVLLVSATGTSQGDPDQDAARIVVHSVERFQSLTSEDALDGHPVHIEGVVLYSDPDWGLFWLEDETERLFLRIAKGAAVPPARTRAVVTGRTTVTEGKVRIADLSIRQIGKAELPPPTVLMPLEANNNRQLNARVTVAGTVVAAEMKGNHLSLVIAFLRKFQVQVTVNNCEPNDDRGMLGAEVEAVGCAAELSVDEDSRLLTRQVFVPDLSDLTVFKRGFRRRFEAPVVSVASLNSEYWERRDPRLLRLRGRVVDQRAANVLVVEERGSTVEVHLESAVEMARETEVEVAGVVWLDDDENVFIDHGEVRNAMAEVGPPSEQEVDLPVIKASRALHALSRQMAAKQFPVEIEGVVTYYDRVWRILFVHDGTRGFYVDDKTTSYALRVGDRVRVTGVSDPGGFAPMAVASRVQRLGHGEIPTPRSVSFGRLLSGGEDSQWVTVGGIVQSVERSQENLVLSVGNSEGEFEAVICGEAESDDRNWLGSDVLLTGVCGTKCNANYQATGIYFHVPDASYVTFRNEAPADPFAIPITPIADLMKHDPRVGGRAMSIRISGVVTYVDESGRLALQDETKGILLRLKSEETPDVCDVIDVIGVPVVTSLSPELQVSRWKRLQTDADLPAAQTVHVTDIQSDDVSQQSIDWRGQFVSMEATVLRNSSDSAIPGLTLQSDDVVFSADLAPAVTKGEWSQIREQSVVRVQGVLDVVDTWDRPKSFRLLCPANAQVEVVRAAPWWSFRHTRLVISGLVVLMVAVFFWGGTLRSTVARQTNRIEHELRARGELATRYNTLVENAGELIFSMRRSGEFISVNPATEQTFDVSNSQLLQRKIGDFLSEESAEVLDLLMARLTTSEPHAVLELTTNRGVVLDAAIHLVKQDSSSEEVHCIARDVSERRKLERQVRHMQKMDSVGQLAAGLAHDYNNLMTVVRVNSEVLLKFGDLRDDNLKSVSLIQNAAERASSVTQQLVAFSRRQTMSPVVIQPKELLGKIVEMLRCLISEDIDIRTTVDEDVPDIRADGGMIEQAVMNLALNARDAMPTGGILKISARSVTVSSETAEQHVEAVPGEYVEIAVRDNGCGIEKDALPSIFEPFYTTKEVGKGTGLGLSTVYGIAKQHEGWVTVESTPGEGSRFAMLLPAIESAFGGVAEAWLEDETAIAGGHETILIVEDDHSVLLTMTRVLTQAGYKVVQSNNGPEALEVWNRMGSSIDLLITDIVMPGGLTGCELARKIQASNPDLPVVYCTGYSSEMTNVSSLSESERLLPKPFETKRLIRVVRELLDGKLSSEEQSSDRTSGDTAATAQ